MLENALLLPISSPGMAWSLSTCFCMLNIVSVPVTIDVLFIKRQLLPSKLHTYDSEASEAHTVILLPENI
jgi:hypothetical protein